MRKFTALLLVLVGIECHAQVESEYERYVREQKAAMEQMKSDQDSKMEEMNKQYEEYVKAEKEAYSKFMKEMSAKWGEGNVAESTRKDWVEYSDNGNSRSIVDFENGEATVEVVTTPGKNVNKEELEKTVKILILNKGKTKDYDSSVEKAEPLSEEPVLQGLVETPSGEVVDENNVDESVKEIVENAVVEVKTVKDTDGKEHQITSVSFELIPDHIRVRAEKFADQVGKYCGQFKVEPSLAYAVIQTESSFNPKAKSYVPAYGLMQIVPASAGADCAQSLKKNFSKPTANYLYDPDHNIEMGVHYISLLRKRYFKDVNDRRKQDLCIIASYNTGAGNLARALRGDTNIKKAIPQINEMTYDELFDYLKKHLLKETQNYIVKVTERADNFRKWMK
ncbi:MAG: murein transglycosylase domain-containing protein [Bacteroidales bacterium]|nr:murein transglycosylase domain-containing protein [Bacteroidales bacterium]